MLYKKILYCNWSTANSINAETKSKGIKAANDSHTASQVNHWSMNIRMPWKNTWPYRGDQFQSVKFVFGDLGNKGNDKNLDFLLTIQRKKKSTLVELSSWFSLVSRLTHVLQMSQNKQTSYSVGLLDYSLCQHWPKVLMSSLSHRVEFNHKILWHIQHFLLYLSLVR